MYYYRWTQLLPLFFIILYYDRSLFNKYSSMSLSVCAFSLVVLKNASRLQRTPQLLLLHYHTTIMTKMVSNDLASINNTNDSNSIKDTINESQRQQQQQKQQQALQQQSLVERKKVILCLHGKNQSGDIFALKIAGAKRKLQRLYDLHFLTAPISFEQEIQLLNSFKNNNNNNNEQVTAPTTISGSNDNNDNSNNVYAWWIRDTNQNHIYVKEAIDYVIKEMIQSNVQYDAIIGFSQGGTLATILSGFCCTTTSNTTGTTTTDSAKTIKIPVLSTIKCIVTAGAPYHEQAFSIAKDYYDTTMVNKNISENGSDNNVNNNVNNNDNVQQDEFWNNVQRIPKFHFAGKNDTLVPLSSTKTLCEKSSRIIITSSSNDSKRTVVNTTSTSTVNSNNSSSSRSSSSTSNSVLHIHEQGHLFPTRSVQVTEMLQFLQQHLSQ